VNRGIASPCQERSTPDGGGFPEPSMENSVGFKMLAKMGWNKDKGLGKMGNGIIDPVEACGQNIYGSKVVEKD